MSDEPPESERASEELDPDDSPTCTISGGASRETLMGLTATGSGASTPVPALVDQLPQLAPSIAAVQVPVLLSAFSLGAPSRDVPSHMSGSPVSACPTPFTTGVPTVSLVDTSPPSVSSPFDDLRESLLAVGDRVHAGGILQRGQCGLTRFLEMSLENIMPQSVVWCRLGLSEHFDQHRFVWKAQWPCGFGFGQLRWASTHDCDAASLLILFILPSLPPSCFTTWSHAATNKYGICWLHHCTYKREKQVPTDHEFITPSEKTQCQVHLTSEKVQGELPQCSRTKESRVKKHFPTEKAFPQDINQFKDKTKLYSDSQLRTRESDQLKNRIRIV